MSKVTISRQAIIDRLQEHLALHDFVRAIWLGGSDATGRTDEWSDIDMQILVRDENVEDTFEVIHEAAESLAPIVHSFRLAEPTWHGHSQELLRIDNAGIFADLDLVVLAKSKPGRFLEFERHGDAMALLDRDGIVKRETFDRAAHNKKLLARFGRLCEQFPLFQVFTVKAVRRGMLAEAAGVFHRATLAPLVELLRMRYAPDLYDFGVRYIDRDLPPELNAKIESWGLPKTGAEIADFQVQAEALFNETLAALEAGEWSLPVG